MRGLVDRIVHEDLPGDVREARIEAARDQNAPVVEANRHRITLQHQVLRHKLLRPAILGEVVLQDHLWVVGVAKEVIFGDRLHLVVEELEGVLVGELHDVVLERSNVFKELCRHLRVQRHSAVFELVERGVIVLVNCNEVLLQSLKLIFILWIVIDQLLKFQLYLGQIV